MQIRKGAQPANVEREFNVDLSRDEVMNILIAALKSKLGPNVRLSDIQVAGDENDRLQSVTLKGIETIPLLWKPDEPQKPTAPPTVVQTPTAPARIPPEPVAASVAASNGNGNGHPFGK
jgi:hypothetical protein